jgi:hypothetical protein
MKKFGSAGLLLALAIGLVSCETQNGEKKKPKDDGHPRRGSISKVESKATTPSLENLKAE